MKISGGTNSFEYDLYEAAINGSILERYFHKKRVTEIGKVLRDKNLLTLDYGCNTGAILLNFQQRGYAIEGFDISENNLKTCSNHAKKQGLTPILHLNTLPASYVHKFNLILLTNVIEYAIDKNNVVSHINELLCQNGTVLVSIAMPRHPFIKLNKLRSILSGRSTEDIQNSEPLYKLDEAELLDIFNLFNFKVKKSYWGLFYVNKYFEFKKNE